MWAGTKRVLRKNKMNGNLFEESFLFYLYQKKKAVHLKGWGFFHQDFLLSCKAVANKLD